MWPRLWLLRGREGHSLPSCMHYIGRIRSRQRRLQVLRRMHQRAPCMLWLCQGSYSSASWGGSTVIARHSCYNWQTVVIPSISQQCSLEASKATYGSALLPFVYHSGRSFLLYSQEKKYSAYLENMLKTCIFSFIIKTFIDTLIHVLSRKHSFSKRNHFNVVWHLS